MPDALRLKIYFILKGWENAQLVNITELIFIGIVSLGKNIFVVENIVDVYENLVRSA